VTERHPIVRLAELLVVELEMLDSAVAAYARLTTSAGVPWTTTCF